MDQAQEIVSRVRAGEVDAFSRIVHAYQDRVRRIVAFSLHDFSTTEDLVQQVFVNAFFHLEQYDPTRDFGAWLNGIARNQVREHLRKHARRAGHMQAYQEHLEQRFANSEHADKHENRLRAALAECRKALSPICARALSLRYDQGLDFTEIARELDRSIAAARQLLQRVRLSLRTCIEERAARS